MPLPISSEVGSDQSGFIIGLRREPVVVCTGELDLAAAHDLREAFATASARIGERVILDLDQVTGDLSPLQHNQRVRSSSIDPSNSRRRPFVPARPRLNEPAPSASVPFLATDTSLAFRSPVVVEAPRRGRKP